MPHLTVTLFTDAVTTLKLVIALTWIPFWIYWLAAATRAKESRGRRWAPVGGLTLIAVLVIVRVFRTGELITSGPYRLIRHPIYTGLLLAVLGTALATNLAGLIAVVVLGGVFHRAGSVEERNLIAAFPSAYPAYRDTTKMLIPFIL